MIESEGLFYYKKECRWDEIHASDWWSLISMAPLPGSDPSGNTFTRRLGKWYGFAENYQKQFLAGEISYDEFCERDAQVWKGMREEELIEIAKTVPFHPGVDDLIWYLKNKGLKLAMVSSGLSILSNWVHQRYGFDYSISNDLLHENGILTGKVKIQVYYDQKAKWVRNILKQFGVKPEESIAIGDSAGDLEMFRVGRFFGRFQLFLQRSRSNCHFLRREPKLNGYHSKIAPLRKQDWEMGRRRDR